MSFILDNVSDAPIEVNGSPRISIDEVTYSMIIVRRYAVLTTLYKPLPQASLDPIYKTAVLVTEATENIEGPITFFNRTYAQIPNSRVEYRQVAFTRPGASQATLSSVTGLAINWNAYGLAPPSTSLKLASVTYSYSTSSLSGNGPIDEVTFNGAPVDFVGAVYANTGIRTTALGPGEFQFEPKWDYLGDTIPSIVIPRWILSRNVTRWKGPIWQAEVVVVDTT